MQVTSWFPHTYSAAGRAIFAIGDVHGRRDQMSSMLDTMRALAAEFGSAGTDLVWLGDVIDRGPESTECIRSYLADDSAFENVIRLCGNHEQLMLLGLGFSPKHRPGELNHTEIYARDVWFANGGRSTASNILTTAGLAVPEDADDDAFGEAVAKALRILELDIPSGFYGSSGSNYRVGDLIFVHGGINPGFEQKRFLEQAWWQFPKRDESDHWAWVRGPFLVSVDPGGAGTLVVHGHTPERPAIRVFSDRNVTIPDNFCDDDQIREYVASGGHRIHTGKLNLDGGAELVVGAEIQDGRYRLLLAY